MALHPPPPALQHTHLTTIAMLSSALAATHLPRACSRCASSPMTDRRAACGARRQTGRQAGDVRCWSPGGKALLLDKEPSGTGTARA